jgi:hypothetical protein
MIIVALKRLSALNEKKPPLPSLLSVLLSGGGVPNADKA